MGQAAFTSGGAKRTPPSHAPANWDGVVRMDQK